MNQQGLSGSIISRDLLSNEMLCAMGNFLKGVLSRLTKTNSASCFIYNSRCVHVNTQTHLTYIHTRVRKYEI